MKEVKKDLDKIVGGTKDITAPIVNAFTNVIKLLMDAGRAVGSSTRRLVEGEICPLK